MKKKLFGGGKREENGGEGGENALFTRAPPQNCEI